MEITFSNPDYLWFLLVIPILIIVHLTSLKSTRRKAIKFANFDAIERVTGGEVLSKNLSLLAIRIIVVTLFVLALSGVTYWYSGPGSNFDFVLALDASNSMLTTDFTPDRIEAAKLYAGEFIDSISRSSKVGVVSFAGTSTVESELSDDLPKVKGIIKNIEARNLGGTDIGEALVTSTNVLLQSNKPRILILLTDGQSNVGVPLKDAINYVKSNQLTIYTIGIGTEKGGNYVGNVTLSLDEETLKLIAQSTDGKYFRAADEKSLRDTYSKIAKITESRIRRELAIPFLVISLILVLIEWSMINTRYRTIP